MTDDIKKESLKCNHEWRLFGTRAATEHVYPVFKGMGPVVCTKCERDGFAEKYKVIERRPHIEPLFGERPDIIIEMIEGREYESICKSK